MPAVRGVRTGRPGGDAERLQRRGSAQVFGGPGLTDNRATGRPGKLGESSPRPASQAQMNERAQGWATGASPGPGPAVEHFAHLPAQSLGDRVERHRLPTGLPVLRSSSRACGARSARPRGPGRDLRVYSHVLREHTLGVDDVFGQALRRRRSVLVAVGCCCCCHRCRQLSARRPVAGRQCCRRIFLAKRGHDE
jgi:hypothetical protein